MTDNFKHRVSKPLSRLYRIGSLDEAAIRRAMEIEAAVLALEEAGARTTRLEEAARSGYPRGFGEARLAEVIDRRQVFAQWLDTMKQNRLPAGPVLDIVVEGKALSRVDRDWGKRKGWARSLLRKGLGLYGTLEAQVELRKRPDWQRLKKALIG